MKKKNKNMTQKQLIIAVLAAMTVASCSTNDYAGDNDLRQASDNAPISFGFDVPMTTRAEGAAAATALGNQFIVYGEKSESSASAPSAGNLVFPNYQVNYTANSAYTTTSNTKNWEYVGAEHTSAYATNIKIGGTAVGTAAQTIKYWDYSASNYVFTAVSALQADITAGYVQIDKLQTGSAVYDKGYTVTLTAAADPSKLYFSDRLVINQGTGTDRDAANAYGGNVKLTFRNAISQVRVAMYETVPGYQVRIKKFYYKNDDTPASFAAMTAEGTDKFYANVPNVATTSAATLTVTYQSSGSSENPPTIAVSGATTGSYIAIGGENAEKTGLKANAVLAETSSTPTYNETTGAYSPVFPQETNATSLKLKLDYELYNSVTGEVITVSGATAEVPAQYLAWKPNYKYTYLFKISDNTNGSTGGSVTGLYPITFDAVEIESAEGEVEYITTVSEPSITTFGVKGGKYSVGKNEYETGSDVYAVVEDAGSLATLSGSNFSIYEVSTSDATNFPVTEASVAEALIEGPTLTAAQVTLKKITCVAGPTLTFQNTVPAEDGTTKTLHDSENKAAKFTTATSKKYALVYEKTAATYTVDAGQTYADETAFNDAGTLYTTDACTTVATWSDASTTYYKRTAVSDKGVYAVKIITCP